MLIDEFRGFSYLDDSSSVTLTKLLEKAHVGASGIVVLGGSVAEGMGRRYSDIDFIAIDERAPSLPQVMQTGVFHEMIKYLPNDGNKTDSIPYQDFERYRNNPAPIRATRDVVNGFKVDVEYLTFTIVHDIFRKIRSCYDDLVTNCSGPAWIPIGLPISITDMRVVHQLLNSVPITNQSLFDTLMSGVSREEICYICYRRNLLWRPVVYDLAGAFLSGKWDQATWVARYLLETQMQGFTHLNGNTNLKMAWLFHYIERLPATYDPLRSQFYRVYNAPTATAGDKREFVMGALDFIDDILNEELLILESNPKFLSPRRIEMAYKLSLDRKAASALHPTLLDGLGPASQREGQFFHRFFTKGARPLRTYLS